MRMASLCYFLQVVLRIVKHCREAQPSLVTGQLLGLDIGSTLEVTSCFPFPVRPAPRFVPHCSWRHASCAAAAAVLHSLILAPFCGCLQSRAGDDEDEAEGANYQLEMMRCLREVNVDNNTVGWCVRTAAVDHGC